MHSHIAGIKTAAKTDAMRVIFFVPRFPYKTHKTIGPTNTKESYLVMNASPDRKQMESERKKLKYSFMLRMVMPVTKNKSSGVSKPPKVQRIMLGERKTVNMMND